MTAGQPPIHPGTTCIAIGASVRALARSLRRIGDVPFAIDLFNDRDLRAIAECRRIDMADYPGGFLAALAELPPLPVIYTGGLENAPDLIAEIQKRQPIRGNRAETLVALRDPFRWTAFLNRHALPTLAVHHELPALRSRFLKKQRHSSGGRGIAAAQPGDTADENAYFQAFAEGRSISAIFRDMSLLGITQQLTGEEWLSAMPFAYCGSVGPIQLPGETERTIRRTAELLSHEFGTRSVWGIDFILDETTNTPYPVEINPRYTASMEVWERATNRSVFTSTGVFESATVVGKAILYAPRDFVFPNVDPDDVADIPHPGEAMAQGWPVISLFAEGDSVAEVETRLRQRAGEFRTTIIDPLSE